MKPEIKIAIGLGVFAVLMGIWYFLNKQEDKDAAAHSATAAQELPELKITKEVTDKITKIAVTNKDKGEVILEKKGDEWKVAKPLEAPANQSNVDQLLKNLEKLELKLQIATGTTSYKKYELEGEEAVHLVAYQGETKVVDMFFGKSGSRGQMARLADKEGVFVVKGYSGYLYGRELKGWRKTEILKFNDENVIQASVENDKGKFSFSKNDDKWSATFAARSDGGELAKEGKPIENFDESKLKNMLRAFKNLRADDFAAEDVKKEDTGIEDAATSGGVVFVKLKDDAGEYTIKVGKKSKGSSRYAVQEGGDGTIYTLGSWSADWAVADVEKFQKEKKGDKEEDDEGLEDDEDDAVKDGKAADTKGKDSKDKDGKADTKGKDAKGKDAKGTDSKADTKGKDAKTEAKK